MTDADAETMFLRSYADSLGSVAAIADALNAELEERRQWYEASPSGACGGAINSSDTDGESDGDSDGDSDHGVGPQVAGRRRRTSIVARPGRAAAVVDRSVGGLSAIAEAGGGGDEGDGDDGGGDEGDPGSPVAPDRPTNAALDSSATSSISDTGSESASGEGGADDRPMSNGSGGSDAGDAGDDCVSAGGNFSVRRGSSNAIIIT